MLRCFFMFGSAPFSSQRRKTGRFSEPFILGKSKAVSRHRCHGFPTMFGVER